MSNNVKYPLVLFWIHKQAGRQIDRQNDWPTCGVVETADEDEELSWRERLLRPVCTSAHSAAQYSAVLCGVVWRGVAWRGVEWRDAARCAPLSHLAFNRQTIAEWVIWYVVVTCDCYELVDSVWFWVERLTLADNFYDVGSFVERAAQTSLPASVARRVDAFTILARVLRPFLHPSLHSLQTIVMCLCFAVWMQRAI